MPYYPRATETVYRCTGCGGWFIPGNVSCCVAHAPGTCCHEYEQRIEPRPVVQGEQPGAAPHARR